MHRPDPCGVQGVTTRPVRAMSGPSDLAVEILPWRAKTHLRPRPQAELEQSCQSWVRRAWACVASSKAASAARKQIPKSFRNSEFSKMDPLMASRSRVSAVPSSGEGYNQETPAQSSKRDPHVTINSFVRDSLFAVVLLHVRTAVPPP